MHDHNCLQRFKCRFFVDKLPGLQFSVCLQEVPTSGNLTVTNSGSPVYGKQISTFFTAPGQSV